MLRIQLYLSDDDLEREFEAYKIADHRLTDSDAGRALLIRGLEAYRGERGQKPRLRTLELPEAP